MSLSYLDLLLGTTIVFVVLYGLMNRQNELPAIEGKALAMVIAVPTPAAQTDSPLKVTVDFLNDGETVESFSREKGDRNPPVTLRSNQHPTLSVDFHYFESESIVLLSGQPPPGLSFRVRATTSLSNAPANKFPRRILELADRYPPEFGLNSAELDVWKWVKESERLILSQSAVSPAEFQLQRNEQLKIYPGKSLAFERGHHLRQGSLPSADLEMRAEMIVARLRADNFQAAKWIEQMTGRQPESAKRVVRTLQYRYGPNATLLTGQAGDDYYTRELRKFALHHIETDNQALRAWSGGTSGGSSLFVDLVSEHVALPLSCTWSYAGAPGGTTEHWKLVNKELTNEMTAEVLIDKFE